MNKVIAIVGPTAVGKTALSVKLAQAENGEIISGDSMQVYRHLDWNGESNNGRNGRGPTPPDWYLRY